MKSRAFRTEVLDCEIEDGPEGTASYLIDVPNGGAVLLRGNRLSKGPRSGNRSTAISIGAEGADRPTPEIRIESNVFALQGGYRTVFVTNFTATPALLHANSLPPTVGPLVGDGRIVSETGKKSLNGRDDTFSVLCSGEPTPRRRQEPRTSMRPSWPLVSLPNSERRSRSSIVGDDPAVDGW